MRGRKPKPAALKEAQGNPGKRKAAEPSAALLSSGEALALPFAKLSAAAIAAYTIIAAELRRINFVRASDEPLLLRYADTLARYWRVTGELDRLGSETYTMKNVNGDKMQRMRPQFMVQERLSKRLESMEDRLGLSPMARQQYLLRLSQAGQQLPMFPKAENATEIDDDGEDLPTVRPESPIGLLKREIN